MSSAKLSEAALELLSEFTLSPDERKQLIKNISDYLTLEKAQDLALEIIENTPDFKEFDSDTRALWLVRMAYMTGFTKAAEAFSDVIIMELREKAIATIIHSEGNAFFFSF